MISDGHRICFPREIKVPADIALNMRKICLFPMATGSKMHNAQRFPPVHHITSHHDTTPDGLDGFSPVPSPNFLNCMKTVHPVRGFSGRGWTTVDNSRLQSGNLFRVFQHLPAPDRNFPSSRVGFQHLPRPLRQPPAQATVKSHLKVTPFFTLNVQKIP